MAGLCEVQPCASPVQKQGVCFRHKLMTVGVTGLVRLKQEREAGVTQMGMTKETIADAKARGVEIQTKGVRSPSSVGLV